MASVPVWQAIGSTAPPACKSETSAVVIVGAGPVGLTLALDLGRRGHRVVVLNRLDFIAGGSKAICFARRTLDIWDALGVGETIAAHGVAWRMGEVFRGDAPEPVFRFDLLPVAGQKMPAFVNLQQYHVERHLIAALDRLPNVDLRWGHELVGLESGAQIVRAKVHVAASAADYAIEADWLIACDGARSPVRNALGLDFEGRVFEDNFLIADVRVDRPRPAVRTFWFDPPFHPGQSALAHQQPDDVWRLDFQLGWDIDRDAAVRPENFEPLVRGLLGPDVAFTPVWTSVYTFQCRRMARFVHDRVVFAGDAAHLVSPFGARGCNGGIADVANLGWKLDRVLGGRSPAAFLDSYDDEARTMADANILASSRSTDFMTPKSPGARALRDAVLDLASAHDFARPFVNSGRLSVAIPLPDSALNTPDEDGASWTGIPQGSPALDAMLGDHWLLERLGGDFVLVSHGACQAPVGLATLDVADAPAAIERCDLAPGSAVLLRPDQYVAARWRRPTPDAIARALDRATGIA